MNTEQIDAMQKMISAAKDPDERAILAFKFAARAMADVEPVTKTLGGDPPVFGQDAARLLDERSRRQLITAAACALTQATNRDGVTCERELTAALADVSGAGLTPEQFAMHVGAAADKIAVRWYARGGR